MKKLDKLVIDRERWARGAPTKPRETNFLLGPDGTMRCLGFCMAQLGVPAIALLKEGEPYEVVREYEEVFDFVDGSLVLREIDTGDDEDGNAYEEVSYSDTDLVGKAISENDSETLTGPEREARIARILSPIAEVVFVDTAAETETLCGMPADFGRAK